MRILEIDTFGRGGLTHYVYNLVSALAARGHQVTFATAAGYELDGVGELPASVRVVKPFGRFTHAARLPGPVTDVARKVEAITDGFGLRRAARSLEPDLIHLHCTNPIALHYLRLLRRLRRPLVSTAHVVTPHERMPLEGSVWGRIHRAPDLVIAHSEVDRRRLLGEFSQPADRVVVIPHGDYGFFAGNSEAVDRASARANLGLRPDDEVALFFGYIREYKGLDLLLDAWPAVVAERPRARLLIAGDPVKLDAAHRKDLEARAERAGAIHRFAYVPFADVATYFAAADALVMPYRRISQSGVLFLALALGVPVVATAVGALPEMLRDGESALLLPPESPAALSGALARLLGDPELRTRLASGGRRVAREHSWESIAERTEQAFDRLVAEHRPSG